jgi:hypothetical protein
MRRMGQFCLVHAVAFPLLSNSANGSFVAKVGGGRASACPGAKPAARDFRIGQPAVRYAIGPHWIVRITP